MGWETWVHRRRRIAELFVGDRVPLFHGRFKLPYCGRDTPFPSDYVFPLWRPFVFTPVRDLFPGSFVDVGANIGQTLLIVKEFDPNWDYVGFEPNTTCFFVSEQLAKANGFQGYRLIPTGLSDETKLVELHMNFSIDPSATVIPGFRGEGWMRSRRFVAVMNGDQALAAIGCENIGVIKIDVEGGELEVLRGVQGCLSKSRPLVVCEVLQFHDKKAVGDFRVKRARELESLLNEHRYLIFRLQEPRTVKLVTEIPDDGRGDWVDYLFVPNERRSEFIDSMKASDFSVIYNT